MCDDLVGKTKEVEGLGDGVEADTDKDKDKSYNNKKKEKGGPCEGVKKMR